MANAITALEQVRALYAGLSMDDQLSVMSDLIQGGHTGLKRCDDFIDALIPVDQAFEGAFNELYAVANPTCRWAA